MCVVYMHILYHHKYIIMHFDMSLQPEYKLKITYLCMYKNLRLCVHHYDNSFKHAH